MLTEPKVQVPACGPYDAEICLVGEAPAAKEISSGLNFQGMSGMHLTMITQSAGVDRDMFRITNISKERAPHDKIAMISMDHMKYWESELIKELNDMPNLKCIVPMGEYPLRYVTKKHDIGKHRGSILKPREEIRQDILVLPTFHPSRVNYQYELWAIIALDFSKLLSLINNNFQYAPPEFNFEIRPTLEKVMERLNYIENHKDDIFTLDIETPRGILSCFGIGWSKYDALCIPFIMGNGDSYWTESEEVILWRKFAEILPKANINNQNHFFDWLELFEYGLKLGNAKYDPMLMHHCLYSTLPHGLDMLTSIYTDMSFYKKDEREEKVIKGSSLFAGREEEHWIYNCKDCCSTWWAIDELKKELEEEKMLDVYFDLYVDMFEPLLEMSYRGVRTDMNAIYTRRKEFKQLVEDVDKELEVAAGWKVNPRSPQQIKKFFVDELGFTPYKKRGGGITMDEKALTKLAYKYQTDIPLRVVESRKASKALSLFSPENIKNERAKTVYSLGRAKTGRLTSRKGRGGMNMQNIKRDINTRKIFLPEKDEILLYPDQEQAEARIVAWLSKDQTMIAIAESGLIHLKNAENLFGEIITKDDSRYIIAKALVHAGNYGIGKYEFARTANILVKEAQYYLDLYHGTYPGIRGTFHKYVEEEINRTRTLYNPFGRRIVLFGRKDKDTYKTGYAYIPQSTVGDINKKALKFIHRRADFITPLIEAHDGTALSVAEKYLKEAIEVITEAYNIKFDIWGITHTVPVEIAMGQNWGELEKIV